MKIDKVEVFPVVVPLKKMAEGAHGVIREQKSVIARVWTDSGKYGLGAVDPRANYDEDSLEGMVDILQNHLIPVVVKEDPQRIRRIVDMMDAAIPKHLGAKAVVEMALFDLLGKALGVPVHTLFGGRVRDEIVLNGWLGIVDPETARSETQDMLDRGFRSLKVKINADLAGAAKRVEAVRSVVRDRMLIRVDANEALSLEQAREVVKALAPFEIEYLEQPMAREKLDEFITLSQSSQVKLMADESIHDMKTLLDILKSGAAQFVKVKIQKMGGFLKTYQAVQVAEAFGIPVVLGHGFGLTINTLAELHLAACTRAIVDGCESVGPIKMADDVVQEPLIMNRGVVSVPTRPGLGVDLDEEKIKKYRYR
jgi:L-alanine-DL-glutamate epimerase-like enolase superfamily enzyme